VRFFGVVIVYRRCNVARRSSLDVRDGGRESCTGSHAAPRLVARRLHGPQDRRRLRDHVVVLPADLIELLRTDLAALEAAVPRMLPLLAGSYAALLAIFAMERTSPSST
jgi:hypothetical protein